MTDVASSSSARSAAFEKLHDLIKDIKYAMLATVDEAGHIRSRPMYTQQIEAGDTLWFFTAHSSGKVRELQKDHQVNASYVAGENRFVSVSGRAEEVRDPAKLQELWNPSLKAWFPKGLDDPDLALIKVNIEGAEYWDATSNKLVQLIGLTKAVLTGKAHAGEGSDHERLTM